MNLANEEKVRKHKNDMGDLLSSQRSLPSGGSKLYTIGFAGFFED
jgi:hypothetical protein